MRVLCIGDSLALPREGCKYECTWYYKLKKYYKDTEFVDYFKRGLRIIETRDLFSMYYSEYAPNIVIIQTGICDCAPRYINSYKLVWKIAIKLASRIGFERFFWTIIKTLFKRTKTCVYTKPTNFKCLYEELIKNFLKLGVLHIIIVKIGHASKDVVASNPFFNENVDFYNSILDEIANKHKDIVKTIHPLDIVDENMFVDGYHCNPNGMDIVFKSIIEKLNLWLL